MRSSSTFLLLTLAALLTACNPSGADQTRAEQDSLGFPWDSSENGKEDVFGRSLVGVPDPYVPASELLDNPVDAEAELKTNMRRRREVAWQSAFKVLEPVPLLGLQDQIEALPECPAEVSTRDIDRCARQDDADACAAFAPKDVDGLCAWDEATSTCQPTCDHLTLPDGQEIPKIPRWATWYGVEDINRIFKHAYAQLTDEERLARAPLSDVQIGDAFHYNHTAVERSSRWPLRRYTDAVLDLYGCEIERFEGESEEDWQQRCAEARQSKFSGSSAAGGGIARMVYSPAMVLHMMRNYPEILACRDDKLADTWCAEGDDCVDPPENFSTCFANEFPADAGDPWEGLDPEEAGHLVGLPSAGGTVLIKATWSRVGFGFELPAYDTDAEALERRIGPGQNALWDEEGDRTYESPQDPTELAFPGPNDIYTIRTSSGGVYRLTGLHIMTKELRHWQWITLWWSDTPDSDFGADRPDSFGELDPVWSNYKMCVVVDYTEADADVLARFEDLPSLQAALAATNPEPGAPTWCSNPYIEHAEGNARTNCIGCHQHAGSRYKEALGDEPQPFDVDEIIAHESADMNEANRYPANGRLRRRTHFAADYSWAFSRLDDLTELVRTEVEYQGARDEEWARRNDILHGEGSPTRGEEVFRNATAEESCTDCHGAEGEGGFGPALAQRFAQKTDWQLLHTIIEGRGNMPAWGERLSDEELTDLFTYLRANFE
ncbi:cytochrome c [Persicimonas caeni]|uniref:Cytochrome c n=1 Tax=Persicimonas caeni TaxID=2292766 RepID=A0A4Y6PM15_PERCE|nr:cytochrome c [Persicimonas caeni]QDG49356.1 cytochrome c [Persicimonas caeni]QED30577.1 cytochrome c [Persicimonas caeni]